jgi:hypothetical protein
MQSHQRTAEGCDQTLWVSAERFGLMRAPTFRTEPPSSREPSDALKQTGAHVATWLEAPSETLHPNAWLYLCRNQMYDPALLEPAVRRNVRRANEALTFEVLEWSTLFRDGFPAYRDTRTRVGLSDGNEASFRARFDRFSRNRAHHVVGAWHETRLVAFMTVVRVDDWAEFEGLFSQSDALALRPNDGIITSMLHQLLAVDKLRVVSYGLSTVQESTDDEGLHRFKLKMGFEAVPVVRRCAFSPAARILANRYGMAGLRCVVRMMPRNRALRKAAGIIAASLGYRDLEGTGG